MRLFTFLSVVVLTMWMSRLQAQDPRFSQFYASPLTLNPAMIGVYEGQFRVVANYRELYASILGNNPYRTIAASFDVRTRLKRSGDYFGIGFSALRDEAGISNFNRTRGNLGLSFMKQLGGSRYRVSDQYLVAGAQVGIGQRGFDFGQLWFTNQFDEANALIDFTAASGEDFSQLGNDIYLDFNAGVLWYALFEENRSFYIGGAAHHLNQPAIALLEDSEDQLHMRWVAHMGGEMPFNDNLSLLPAVAVMGQQQSFSTTAGANFRYTNRDWRELAIRIGAWAHIANRLDSGVFLDAIAATAILEVERWQIGISYDVTTSVLSQANNARGAFELSLIYTHPEQRRVQVNCPNF